MACACTAHLLGEPIRALLVSAALPVRWSSCIARPDISARRAANAPHPVCEPHRYEHRVLRFLYLRDGRGAGVSQTVLSERRSGDGVAAVVGDLRAGVF